MRQTPILKAGLTSQLRQRPEVELLDETQVDEARVAVVVADKSDEETVRALRALQPASRQGRARRARGLRPPPCQARRAAPGCSTIVPSETPFSVMRGPPGSYVAEWLAGVLEEWDRWQSAVWLRPRDTRPAALARLLGSACHHRWGEGGEQEGPPQDAPAAPLDETIRHSPDKAVIVLELGGRVTRGLGQLVESIRPAVADRGISLVAVAESRFHTAFRRGQECHIQTTELIDPYIMEKTLDVPSRHRDRLRAARPAVRCQGHPDDRWPVHPTGRDRDAIAGT